jgi:hypothetical protein
VALADASGGGARVVALDLDGDGYEQTDGRCSTAHRAGGGITVGSVLAEDPIGVAAEKAACPTACTCILPASTTANGWPPTAPPIDLDGWRGAGRNPTWGCIEWAANCWRAPMPPDPAFVGGGEMLSSPGLPDNLRGCWNSPGSVEADPVPPGPPDRSTDPNTGSSSAEAFDPGPADLPPTRFRSASY